MEFWFVLIVIVAVLITFAIRIYNRLIGMRLAVAGAWSNIDVLLKQRHDEVPNLVSICKGYMAHEQDTLAKLVALRNQAEMDRARGSKQILGEHEAELNAEMRHVLARVEDYPELKASDNFLQLSARLSQIEDAIADRREFYNEAVKLYNTRCAQFPELLIARTFGFRDERFFDIPELVRMNVPRADLG